MTDLETTATPRREVPPAPTTPPPPQVRRPGAGRFVPKAAPTPDGVVVQRNVLQPSQAKEKALTSRQRRIAGNLPDWEPLPPGELLVRRGA